MDIQDHINLVKQEYYGVRTGMTEMLKQAVNEGMDREDVETAIKTFLYAVQGDCDVEDGITALEKWEELKVRHKIMTLNETSEHDDPIMDINELAKYMNRSKNWIYKHSHELPKIPTGKHGKLLFRKSKIDAYLKKHTGGE